METKYRKRLTAFVTDDVNDYVVKTADEIGISISGFINLCINQYRQQNVAFDAMSQIGGYLKRLEELENKMKK